ncbi:hypothetical protein CKO42_15185 [Lamprobacter modestohalophilus]|uniref:Uncharacterized protein n=2 Tax=Lamprobacter modestohalophilus TaxID=1064514 RepID=A0A9X0WA76_9GAMM|nr:hypothetical protein [Lamprobacter modestohalophilus]
MIFVLEALMNETDLSLSWRTLSCLRPAVPACPLAPALAACLLGLMAPVAALWAADGFEPERLDLICVEQPMRAVSFGAPGELSYGEQEPKESDPVDVLVTKSRPGEDFTYDFAVIESSAAYLQNEEAIWMTGKQIEAQQGRFKINLSNLMMTLTETDPDGSARFRRFECEQRITGNDGTDQDDSNKNR